MARLFTSHFSNFMRDTFQIFPLFPPHFAHLNDEHCTGNSRRGNSTLFSSWETYAKAQFSSHFQSSCHVLTCRQFDCHSSSLSHYFQHSVSNWRRSADFLNWKHRDKCSRNTILSVVCELSRSMISKCRVFHNFHSKTCNVTMNKRNSKNSWKKWKQ